MRVLLKIGNRWTEMRANAKEGVELSHAFDNLENPSSYMAEWSYSLKLPRCPENNHALSDFVQLDSAIVSGGYDPSVSLEYIILDDTNAVISTGTASIDTIDDTNYNFTLAGSFSTVFNKLLNSGWDSTNDDPTYTLFQTDWLKKLKGSNAVYSNTTNRMSVKLVKASWLIDTPIFSWDTMKATNVLAPTDSGLSETQAFIAQIVGFAPTSQGKPDIFDTTKWLKDCTYIDEDDTVLSSGVKTITEFGTYRINVVEEPKAIERVKDGLIEAQVGEWRNYYQQPFIYLMRLWQFYQEEAVRITGYTLNLDAGWFNENNPLLANVVYMLPKLQPATDTTTHDITHTTAPTSISYDSNNTFQGKYTGLNTQRAVISSQTVYASQYKKVTFNYNLAIDIIPTSFTAHEFYFSPMNFFYVEMEILRGNTVVQTKNFVLLPIPSDGTYTTNNFQSNIVQRTAIRQAMADGYTIASNEYSEIGITTQGVGIKTGISGSIGYFATSGGNYSMRTTVRMSNDYDFFINTGAGNHGIITASLANSSVRATVSNPLSRQVISMERLFANINPFSILLKYSKMAHLLWLVDDLAKTIRVVECSKYLNECKVAGITDITLLVDKSRNMEIQPLSWKSHSVEFNFDEMDSLSDYEERYGLTYGSKRLITTNRINRDNEELLCHTDFDTILPCVKATEVAAKLTSIVYRQPTALMVESLGKPLNNDDGKPTDTHGNFYVRQANRPVTDSVMLQGWRTYVTITEDDPIEDRDLVYCWHGNNDGSTMEELPAFDICSRDKSVALLFAEPREVYHPDTYPSTMAYLYEAKWKKYIEEVYDPTNKSVVLYARLKRATFEKVRKNPLVQVRNCLYLLCKLEGWQEHDTLCKLTLRQIHNLENLTT